MERLQKVIANHGYCSRRKAEDLIAAGKVYVNGEKITELGTKVSGGDQITVEGITLTEQNKEYYLLNNPRGVVSTTNDELGRKNIIDLIKTNARIYPIGRLDYDTTGLIILTNDGELTNLLSHPSFEVEKTYVAKLNKVLRMEDYHRLKKGITIEGVRVIPNRLKIKSKDVKKDACIIEITIVEGRNHIIKKIFESMGYAVEKLKRTKYDFLDLTGLNSGEYRELSIKEVKTLYSKKK